MEQYTNELTLDIINGLKNPWSTDELKNLRAEERDFVLKMLHERENIAILAIYRYACEGALTRDGGIIQKSSGRRSYIHKSGVSLRSATVGDVVMYPNGGTARIISGATGRSTDNGRSPALVGSLLDNGDIIISTPHPGMLVEYEDNRFGDDFLKPETVEVWGWQ